MARPRGGNTRGKLVMGQVRRDRAGLLRTTALQAAAVLAFAAVPAGRAAAQPAPTARPQGGQVVGGQASISQNPTQTNVLQGSQRAAIDWRSFDVGSQHTVTYQQPNSSAVVLNRVTGPDPSQIAGRIQANGQVIITNQSGVVFHQGSQVNAAGLVVSAAGITNQNFMAGRMVFDQAPRPDAQVTNAGSITVKEAGLAALVAPRVANSGTITARMGRAVLAGAETHTVDLYGDGLLSIDVTGKVRQAPRGADGKPVTALVTNTGTVVADGGTVTLTAAAADGIVQDLVQAGGRIRANTVGNRQGRIEVAGTGGSVVVEGRLGADGREPGSVGGTVALNASGAVAVAGGARVTASGDAGGGTIAVGTTPARARSVAAANEPMASRVSVAGSARISANARRQGNGGNVTLLSSGSTTMDGSVEARGGNTGGNGGVVEVSVSNGRFGLNGRVDTSAPKGRMGRILLDPYDLNILADGDPTSPTFSPAPGANPPQIGTDDGPASGTSFVRAATVRALTGDVELQASHDITLNPNANLAMPNVGQSITLTAGNRITISLGSTISGGPFQADACFGGIPGGSVTLNAGAGGISLLGTVSTAVSTTSSFLNGRVTLNAPGGDIVQGGGSISTYQLNGGGASAALNSAANRVNNIGFDDEGGAAPFTTTVGGFSLANAGNVPLVAYVNVPDRQTIQLTTDTLRVGELRATAGTVAVQPSTPGRPLELTTGAPTPGALSLTSDDLASISRDTLRFGSPTAGDLTLRGGALDLRAAQPVNRLELVTGGRISQTSGSTLLVATLAGQAGGSVLLPNANTVPELNGFTAGGTFALHTTSALGVTAPLTAANVNLSTQGGGISLLANVTATAAGGYVRLDTWDGASNPDGSPDLSTSGDVTSNGPGAITSDRYSGLARTVLVGGQARIGQVGFDLVDPDLGFQVGAVGTYDRFYLASERGFVIGGPLFSQAGSIELFSTGAITQTTAGTVSTPLFGVTAGSVTLTNPGNSVPLLWYADTTGSFSLATNGNLTVNGPAAPSVAGVTSTAGDVTLTSPGTLTLAGDVTGGTVTLNSVGATIQTGGIITANTLTGQAGSRTPSVLLPNANKVGALGNYTVSADPSGTPASFTLFNAQPLQVTGTVLTQRNGSAVPAGTVSLSSSGSIAQAAGSAIRTGTLVGSAASAAFDSPLNQVGTLGGYTTSAGGLSLFTTLAPTSDGDPTPAPLGVQGTNQVPTGQQITLRADQMDFGSASTLSALGGTVTLAPLTGGRRVELIGDGATRDANSLTLRQGGLNRITTGTLQLGVAGTGPINLGNSGDAINLTNRATVLRLTSAGAVTQGNGGTATLTVPTIAGTAASASLPGANGIDTLADFNVAGAFALNSVRALTVSGPVQAGTQAGISSAAGLTVAGNVTAPNVLFTTTAGGLAQTAGTITGTSTVRLGIVGDVAQSNGALLVTDLLQGTAGSLSLTTRGNQIANLGPFDAGTSLVLLDGRSLTVVGAVDPPVLTLDVLGDLAINSTLTGGTVTLNATGAITEGAAGRIFATTLQGTAASATLGQANQVGTLAGFASPGGFLLQSSGTPASPNLVVAGPVTDGTSITLGSQGGITVQGNLTAPSISLTANRAAFGGTSSTTTLRGTIQQGAGTISGAAQVALLADDAISQTGGSIIAGTLTGASGRGAAGLLDGRTTLLSSGNQVGTLGSFSSVGGFTLVDGRALQVAGTVRDATGVALTASGSISQAGGSSIQTGRLAVASTDGDVGLTSELNQVASLGASSSAGDFALTDAVALGVTGAVQAGGTGRTLTLTADTVQLQPGGSLTAAGGTVALAPLSNNPFQLASFVPAGTTSAVTADTLRVGRSGGGPLGISGAFVLTGVGTLDLRSGGAITEAPGASLQVARLVGAGASAALDGPNQVGTLGAFATTGGFSLRNGTGLAVAGPVTDGTSVTITTLGPMLLQGDVTAPTVSLTAQGSGEAPGSITQAAGTVTGTTQVSLRAEGGIAQFGGALAAGTLTGSSGAAASLASSGNQVAVLGDFSSAGGFTLANGRALRLAGTVSDDTRVGLSTTAGDLVLAGTVTGASIGGSMSGGSAFPAVTLSAAGALTQPAGRIDASLLRASGTSVSLGSTANRVSALGTSSSGADFALTSSVPLQVTGDVVAGSAATRFGRTLSLTADTIQLAGGSLTAAGGTVALAPLGTGPFTLGSFVPAGTVAAVTANVLRVGSVTAGPLSISGAFNLSGVGTLDLRSGGAITEAPGVSLQVGRLTGSAASATLDGPNLVSVLGEFSTASGFSLANAQGLDVAGSLTAGNGSVRLLSAGPMRILGGFPNAGSITAADVSLTTTTGGLAADGAITGRTAVRLQVAGDVTQDAITGQLTTPLLQGSAGSVSLPSLNQVGALGSFASKGDFLLRNALDPDVAGAVSAGAGRTLSIISNGIRFLPGGSLAAPDGRVALQQLGFPGYRLTSLVPAGGGSLVTAGTLDVGLTSSIAVTGAFDLSGVGQLALRSTGDVTQAPGSGIQVARLTGNAASLLLDGANRIGTLGSFSTANGFTLSNAQGLTVAGTVQDGVAVRLSAAGALAVNGTVGAPSVQLASTGLMTQGAGALISGLGGPVALRSGDAILLAGTIATPGQLSLDANGHVEQLGGRIAAGSLTGTAVELASLPSGTNAVGTLGRFALTGSTFILVNGQPLVVQGPVASGAIRIDAAGRLVLAGGQLLTREALLRVLAADGTGSLVQQGTTLVGSADGNTTALRLALVGGGTVSLDNLQAAGANLVLDLGGGRATGNAVLGNLLVLGSGGSADLSGQVAGRTDASAATLSSIDPRIDANYLFNGCIIATACGPTIPPIPQLLDVPVVSELFPKSFQDTLLGSLLRTNLFTADLFTLGILRDPADPNLVLPNISDRDY